MGEDLSKYNGEGTTLRRAQLRMLDILTVVDEICRRHGLVYWLDGGTALGQVRHGGFIPWDDDLDIAMMRRDYLELCRILKKELPADMVFQDRTTERRYRWMWAKVRDRNSVLRDPEWDSRIEHRGVFIDIFPMERGSVEVKNFVERVYGRAFRHLRSDKKGVSYFAALALWPFANVLVGVLRAFAFLCRRNDLIYAYGVSTLGRYQLDGRDFLPVRDVPFEGRMFMGQANPEGYLKKLYGDYMTIPPPEKRRVHADEIVFCE